MLLIPSCRSRDTRAHQVHHSAAAQQGMWDMKQIWQHNTGSEEAMHFPVHSTVVCINVKFAFYQELRGSYVVYVHEEQKGINTL